MVGDEGNWPKAKRVDYAKRLLQKNFLPHISTEMGNNSNIKKSFFLGYMVQKLLNCSLNRNKEDDRDHISNKRMDLAGPMTSRLFHSLLYRYAKVQNDHIIVSIRKCAIILVRLLIAKKDLVILMLQKVQRYVSLFPLSFSIRLLQMVFDIHSLQVTGEIVRRVLLLILVFHNY